MFRDDGLGGRSWRAGGPGSKVVAVADNHEVAAPADDPTGQLWVVATIGRLASQGLLERPADSTDPVAVAGQRLLITAGWLDADPFGPSERLRSLLPAGAPLAAISGFVRELLAMLSRYAEGAAAGWAETDPELIRSRGAASGAVVLSLLERCRPYLPGLAERLDRPGAAFLDVGTGAAGAVIAMCHAHAGLRAVGVDTSALAVTVAREQVAAARLSNRAEIREQSVAAIEDVDAFDLLWVPQAFLPEPVLAAALPRLHRAARRGAGLVMAISTNSDTGVSGAVTDLRNLMTGGGTLSPQAAGTMLQTAGFSGVEMVVFPAGTVMVARR
jgi:SAM-dependent methyltransferase